MSLDMLGLLHSHTDVFFYALAASIPLGAGITGAGLWWIATRRLRVALAILASVLAFCLLDLAMFRAVRYLGVSFGSPRVPFLLMTLARGALWAGSAGVLLAMIAARRTFRPLSHRRPAPHLWWGLPLGLNLLVSGCLADAVFVEPGQVKLERLEVTAPGLVGPLRVVQLSDIHIERLTDREDEAARMVNDLQPDLILLTGDYVNTSFLHVPETRRQTREFLSRLRAGAGIFAVWGNCDETWWRDELFGGTGIHLLEDRIVSVEADGRKVNVLGLSKRRSLAQDRAALAGLARSLPADEYNVLLYHTPDLMPEAAATDRIDLYLAGHTHGGQVRLPWYGAIFTFSIYGKRYESGAYREGRTTLYVNRGLGVEGGFAPRVRFLCPPEVTLITVSGNEDPVR